MRYWKKYSSKDLAEKIDASLLKNINFSNDIALGYPASKLNEKVFYGDAPFLKDAPLLRTYVANPNHIGCHTLGKSEGAFRGTHELEKELLNVLAVDIFKSEPDAFDGYVATGGTEANIQALWIYRNHFVNKLQASFSEISIVASEDTHYSIPKGANLLGIDLIAVPVDFETRIIDKKVLINYVTTAKENGKKYFIVVSNMATTMFGSVDDPNLFATVLTDLKVDFKIHIDGAFGGFIYPFSKGEISIDFDNQHIDSIAIDAHKMPQAPYGTGIFMCRKNLIENVLTKEAHYVNGMDLTLCGSRSGANALAVWMILFSYGPHKWFEKISIILMRTKWLCEQLDALKIGYYRHANMNIVTMKSKGIPKEIAKKFDLVPDTHNSNRTWYKIVLMDHVELDHLEQFINALKQSQLV
jgi:tyrosine decarboxylase/aspartate 1-decarboxylase